MELHAYQRRAVEHLHENPRAGLFMDMGLGKTATVLSALTPAHLPALVVAPKRVAERVWPVERRKWRPDLTMAVAAGSAAERRAALGRRCQVTVIGRDNIRDVTPGRYRTVVLDELSSYKNRQTARWRAARKICNEATSVWGLTGTPAPNGLLDLWAQLFLLDGGERLGRGITSYRSAFFSSGHRLPTGAMVGHKPLPGADEEIHRRIDDICLSMKASDYLDLPPTTYNTVEVDLPRSVRATYDELKAELVVAVTDVLGAESMRSAANAAVLTNRLSQITAGFLYPDTDEPDADTVDLHDAKIEALREIVDGTGSPVLVFYRYEREAERIREAFPQARGIDDRGAQSAWDRGELPMMIAHPASAGHGLNLQHGGYTIAWTTLTWSLEEWEQANARLARQGQADPVVVHLLLAPDTVDEANRARLIEKAEVQDALMAALGITPQLIGEA